MVLLVIDTQELIMTTDLYNFDNFVQNIKTLIETARMNQIEVIYVRHDDGADEKLTKGKAGYHVSALFQPKDEEKIFDKDVNSPFKASGLLAYLKDKEETEVILTGLQTDFCIHASVVCAFEHGFQVYVPAYANTTVDNLYMSGKQSYEYYNTFLWKNRYAQCLSMEEMLQIIRP